MKLAFFVFGIILIVALSLFFFLNKQKEDQVLGLISPEVVVTPEISPAETTAEVGQVATLTATMLSTPSATVKAEQATPQPTPTPSIPPATSQEISSYVDRFATQYGIDPNIIRHIAVCESGFRSDAKNLIYGGLFQFDSNTWINYRRQMGKETNPDLRFSAEEAVQTAAYVLSVGKGKIWPNCLP